MSSPADDIRLDLPALGYPIQAVIKVRLGSHGAEHVTALYDALVRIPGCSRRSTSPASTTSSCTSRSRAPALRDIVLEHITVHPVVRHTETQLVFETRAASGCWLPGLS